MNVTEAEEGTKKKEANQPGEEEEPTNKELPTKVADLRLVPRDFGPRRRRRGECFYQAGVEGQRRRSVTLGLRMHVGSRAKQRIVEGAVNLR